MTDFLLALQTFTAVARTESFSGAARELGSSQPTVSRIVAELERRVGTKLLSRTTRAVVLTEAGLDYLGRIEPILLALEEADHAVRGTGELRGVLRVASSTTIAAREILPRISTFLEKHPNLRMEFLVADRRHSSVGDRVDVAVQVGLPPEPSAISKKLNSFSRMLVASPRYLSRAGSPENPRDLARHAIVMGPASSGPNAWTFRKDGAEILAKVSGRIVLDSNEAAISAAASGLGITSTGELSCRREMALGELVRVLPDWDMMDVEMNAVLPAGRAAKPSAKAFAEFLAADFQRDDGRAACQGKGDDHR